MKSIIAIGLALFAGQAVAQPMKPQLGPLATRPGNYVPDYAPAPDQPPPSFYAPPTTPRYTPSYSNPTFPSAPKPPTMAQPDMLKPYKPKSVYSERGGLDSYPKPTKPKGYVDLR